MGLKSSECQGTLSVFETEVSFKSSAHEFHFPYNAALTPAVKGNGIELEKKRFEVLDPGTKTILLGIPDRIDQIRKFTAEYNAP